MSASLYTYHTPALLALEDGTYWTGISAGAVGDATGELVFNTSMTGYQEILTDPSYCRQMVTLTAAHIGNTGCNPADWESSRVFAEGLVIRSASAIASNYRSTEMLTAWLQQAGVVAIAELDTRAITRHLRTHGSMRACITTDIADPRLAVEKARQAENLAHLDLARVVSRKTIERWYAGEDDFAKTTFPQKSHVVVFDYGVKNTILKILYDRGAHVTIVPAETCVAEVLALNPDGIVFSNGPGDPAACDYAIAAAQQLLAHDIPLLGICLGFQILGLAFGVQSYKMKFGHHGGNHPVIETEGKQRVFITSQNHGFALDENTLPDVLMVTHRSLFDGSLQGFRHRSKPIFGFQGHPEASPGPHDMAHLFDVFFENFTGLTINSQSLRYK